MNSAYASVFEDSLRLWKFRRLELVLEYSTGAVLPPGLEIWLDLCSVALRLLRWVLLRTGVAGLCPACIMGRSEDRLPLSPLEPRLTPTDPALRAAWEEADENAFLRDPWFASLHQEAFADRRWGARPEGARPPANEADGPRHAQDKLELERLRAERGRACAKAVREALSTWAVARRARAGGDGRARGERGLHGEAGGIADATEGIRV
jgi:hypothetical protein